MPTYDYQCDTCNHRFELRQSFDAEPVATCPECQNSSHRKFHAVPIVFKGSGFYVNDYGKRSGSVNGASESKEPSDSSSKSETKSESSSDSGSKSEKPSKTESKAKSGSKSAKTKGE